MSMLEWNLGPILLGIMLNIWLYGILVTQVTLYYTVYRNDHMWLKVLVAWLMLLDTLNTAFDIGFIYRYTISLFGDFEAMGHSHWFFHVEPAMTVMISSTVQGFFAWRIARFTGHAWLGWSIAAAVFVQFLAGVGTTIGAWIVVDFAKFQTLKPPIIIWLSTSAAIDVAVASILSWHLHRNRTGFSKTDDIITRLIRLTVQTGLLTSIWAVADLILYLTVPNNLHLVLNLPLCKLYTNSLISTLNARGIRGSTVAVATGGISMTGAYANAVIRNGEQPKIYQGPQRASKTEDSFELDDYAKPSRVKSMGAKDLEGNYHATLSSNTITVGTNPGKRTDSLRLPLQTRTGPHTIASDEWSLHSQPSEYGHKPQSQL